MFGAFRNINNYRQRSIGGTMGNVKNYYSDRLFPESGKALKYASSLAKQINAEIIALHVLDDLTGDDGLLPFSCHRRAGLFLGPSRRTVRSMFCSANEPSICGFHRSNRPRREQVKLKRLVRLGTVRKEIIAVARERISILSSSNFATAFSFATWQTESCFE